MAAGRRDLLAMAYGWHSSGEAVALQAKYPGDSAWSQQGVGESDWSQSGAGDSAWSQTGVGSAAVSQKES